MGVLTKMWGKLFPLVEGHEERVVEQINFQALPDNYADLGLRAGQAREVEAIRDTIERLIFLDNRVMTLNGDSLRQVAEVIAGILSARDRDIERIVAIVAEVDEALDTSDGKEVKSLDERTRVGLDRTHQMLLKDKARAIMYLQILLEIYRIIHEVRTERQRKVDEIEAQLQAIEAAEDRAKRAYELIGHVLETARLDRQRLEDVITEVSPQLLHLVTQAADLNADLIIQGADLMHRAHGTVEGYDSLDFVLTDVGEAMALPQLITDRLSGVERLLTLRALVGDENMISADVIADFQASLSAAVSDALGDRQGQQMERAGHEPNIHRGDDEVCHVGTCSLESPESVKNVVSDVKPQAYLAGHCPQETCNGNVVGLAAFKAQFNALSGNDRKNLNWQQVLEAVGSVESLLQIVGKLENAQVFEVDENNNLVFCDGGDEVPNSTLGKNYFTCRNEAKEEGLELFLGEEYRRLQERSSCKYEKNTITWLESKESPSFVLYACWRNGRIIVDDRNSYYKANDYGVRRLLRVNLNFGS